MIKVYVDRSEFEYDIHSLVKAFYQTEDVKVLTTVLEDFDFYISLGQKFTVSDSDKKLLGSVEVSEDLSRVERKNALKRLLYTVLTGLTGKTLAWGDLTGIRPTKIARKLIEEGKDDDFVKKYMQDTYLVGDEKCSLAIDIAKRELKILEPLHEKGYSLYIGIPFCPTTCLYCSFTSEPICKWKDRVNDYLSALEKEISFVAGAKSDKVLDTIYIGGGTPTTLSASELDRLLTHIDKSFDLSKLLEFTVEAGRADSITLDKLKVLKAHGVTRISVNPQTMNKKTLDFIGRMHSVSDVINAFNLARETGFNNINTDIILGLPGEGETEVKHTIDEIVKLSPDSLTVHSLAVKRGSRLHERILEKGYTDMINTDATMRIAANGAREMSMNPYYLYRQKNMAGNFENTGYSREGLEGIYNILIMEEVEPIVALGPGSVSKVIGRDGKLYRDGNVKDVSLYISDIDEMIRRKKDLFALE